MTALPIDLEGDELQIDFRTFGDERTASSRLRAFKIAEALTDLGHSASVNAIADEPRDVQVFQKVRDLRVLRAAHLNSTLTVYDFDDHYLLDDSGARDDIVHFMNLVDIVTVGSGALVEDALRFHDRVVLFENPIDSDPGIEKPRSQEMDRIGWFGHQSNLGELTRLSLSSDVTTVTKGGDIEWALDTIDSALVSFDLVLLPLSPTPWNLAKNANRMLKCLALGVPVLATETPEHRRIADELGLPPEFLIEIDGDWDHRIGELREKYADLADEMSHIRHRAWESYGVDVVARRWLEFVREASEAVRVPIEHDELSSITKIIDVVVMGDADSVGETVRSLRAHELPYSSVTAIAPGSLKPSTAEFEGLLERVDQHSDYFDIFASLDKAVASRSGARILFIEAGTRLTRGFFAHLTDLELDGKVWVPRTQFGLPSGALSEVPPTRHIDYLSSPLRPSVLVFDRALYEGTAGLRPSLASLAMWDLTLQMLEVPRIEVIADSTPVAVVDPRHENRDLLDDYATYLGATDPGSRADLPSLELESDRLLHTLASEVVARNHLRYSEYVSTILADQWSRHEALLKQARVGRAAGKSARGLLSALNARTPDQKLPPPRLVRSPEGKVVLLDGHTRRHVSSRILAAAFEEVFGEIHDIESEDLFDRYPDGPPMVLIRDEEGSLYCVAGGRRYRVLGLPESRYASSAHLDEFPLAPDVINVDLANVGRAETERDRKDVQRLLGARTGDLDSLQSRYESLATKHDRLANRRLVRMSLRLASLFRPLFRSRRKRS